MMSLPCVIVVFFFNDTATTEIYTLSLHDALPISEGLAAKAERVRVHDLSSEVASIELRRSEEHTSELQSPCNLVCRLLLENKLTCWKRIRQYDYVLYLKRTQHISTASWRIVVTYI